jgi:hypothetical protein
MSEEPSVSAPAEVSSPPPAGRSVDAPADPRGDLLRLADLLRRTPTRRVLAEYLRLRRVLQ